jgi:hypothetical protein
MTVQQLIDKLKTYNPNIPVKIAVKTSYVTEAGTDLDGTDYEDIDVIDLESMIVISE